MRQPYSACAGSVTVEFFDAHLLVATFACLASMQMTGFTCLRSSVHSHVAVGPVSRPIRTTFGAYDFDKRRNRLRVG